MKICLSKGEGHTSWCTPSQRCRNGVQWTTPSFRQCGCACSTRYLEDQCLGEPAQHVHHAALALVLSSASALPPFWLATGWSEGPTLPLVPTQQSRVQELVQEVSEDSVTVTVSRTSTGHHLPTMRNWADIS